MLLTLEQESKRQRKPMPSPERLEKVTSHTTWKLKLLSKIAERSSVSKLVKDLF